MQTRILPILLLLFALAMGGSGCVVLGPVPGLRDASVEGVLALPGGGSSRSAGPFVVYLEGGPSPEWSPWRTALQEVRHDGEGFSPQMAVARAGRVLRIRNRSGLHHRLFWLAGSRRRALPLEPGEDSAAYLQLSEPGVSRIYCELHPDEHFSVFAVPTSHYTVVAKPGRFAIDSVPPGPWRLHVWSERFEAGVREIEVEPSGSPRLQQVKLHTRSAP